MPKKRSETKSPRARASRSSPVPTLKLVDYLGLNHAAVNVKINPNVQFRCYMSVTALSGKGRYPAAVYYDSKPNREAGHQDYMLIHSSIDPGTLKSQLYITGRSQEELDKDRIHDGMMCLSCGLVLVSLDQHHFFKCGCSNEAFVDGGQNPYSRFGAVKLSKIAHVKVDMLTGEIEVDKPRKKR